MKKIMSLLALALLLFAMAVPAFADDNCHQVAQVLEMTEGAVEEKVPKPYHLQDQQMMQVLRDFSETEDARTILLEDADFQHLTMIRQRDVSNDGQPTQLSLRAWGACNRYLVVLFKPLDQEDWTIPAMAQGEFIDVTLPGDGQYVLAWSW